jgi:predicted house-cleaning noncanonical NTP pyrophosphatase (MazG superfamily)
MNIDKSLSQVFDIEETTKQEIVEYVPSEIVEFDNKVESDYNTSRDNLHELLSKGKEALETALTVAKQSEHPRAFEVVGNLMKQLADINQQLLDVHQQKKKLEEPSKINNKSNVTNNSIFVGSTAELSNMIKKLTGE